MNPDIKETLPLLQHFPNSSGEQTPEPPSSPSIHALLISKEHWYSQRFGKYSEEPQKLTYVACILLHTELPSHTVSLG